MSTDKWRIISLYLIPTCHHSSRQSYYTFSWRKQRALLKFQSMVLAVPNSQCLWMTNKLPVLVIESKGANKLPVHVSIFENQAAPSRFPLHFRLLEIVHGENLSLSVNKS